MRKGVTARWGLKEARSDSRDPMDKNRIGGNRGWTSGQGTAKSVSTKGPGCKSGGCAAKAGELTSGGLLRVPPWGGLRESRGALSAEQESAEGIVGGGNEPE
jgi:hypothetical protein